MRVKVRLGCRVRVSVKVRGGVGVWVRVRVRVTVRVRVGVEVRLRIRQLDGNHMEWCGVILSTQGHRQAGSQASSTASEARRLKATRRSAWQAGSRATTA